MYVSFRRGALNYVLNDIPVFFVSFLKNTCKGLEESNLNQRMFLWGGVNEDSKIYWVSWVDVCKPKSKDGLMVKYLCLINLSLLEKWR